MFAQHSGCASLLRMYTEEIAGISCVLQVISTHIYLLCPKGLIFLRHVDTCNSREYSAARACGPTYCSHSGVIRSRSNPSLTLCKVIWNERLYTP